MLTDAALVGPALAPTSVAFLALLCHTSGLIENTIPCHNDTYRHAMLQTTKPLLIMLWASAWLDFMTL